MTGVKLPTICKRLSRGRSIEEAISTERLVMNRVNYKYFVIVGGKKVSLHSEAKRRGVRYKTALDRHKAGKTFKEVFNPLPKYSLTYDNQTYSLRYWSRLRDIPYSTLKWRYNEGWKVAVKTWRIIDSSVLIHLFYEEESVSPLQSFLFLGAGLMFNRESKWFFYAQT